MKFHDGSELWVKDFQRYLKIQNRILRYLGRLPKNRVIFQVEFSIVPEFDADELTCVMIQLRFEPRLGYIGTDVFVEVEFLEASRIRVGVCVEVGPENFFLGDDSEIEGLIRSAVERVEEIIQRKVRK